MAVLHCWLPRWSFLLPSEQPHMVSAAAKPDCERCSRIHFRDAAPIIIKVCLNALQQVYAEAFLIHFCENSRCDSDMLGKLAAAPACGTGLLRHAPVPPKLQLFQNRSPSIKEQSTKQSNSKKNFHFFSISLLHLFINLFNQANLQLFPRCDKQCLKQ